MFIFQTGNTPSELIYVYGSGNIAMMRILLFRITITLSTPFRNQFVQLIQL